ncbi:DNA primase [Paractinoplanes lichenicola]|uniref:DNA primase n=1 Tax=Paractinoplanes lichenicola TaxID=2802976 RepID=A0ABS1VJC5_9ACTN|nr:DNA primase [Actinoplanes lichenicola]MBL7254807.1 DNA primase [Actinoplanes lichenicola]
MTSQSDEPEASAPVAAKSAAQSGGLSGRALWDETGVEPVEIALPGGVALTLRAYRKSSTLTPTEIEVDEDDPFEARKRRAAAAEDDDEEVIVDDEFQALLAQGETDEDGKDAKAADEPDPADFEDEADEAGTQAEDEEVPAFLTHKGRLIAFKTPESLVSFIRSGAPHDLAQIDSWVTLADRVQSTDIDPLPENRYELDLVVENLRGGHDTWDLPLLIAAGEVARDLGHALRLKPVILALAPGSPLDDLDESLRSAENGGMGGFFGRRRLKKIGAQQASLGWRSVIGKISAAVDWRD